MDEVLSYTLVSDHSLLHLNNATVSGMDANPPLFTNLYWFIGHYISLNIEFLRAVTIMLFAVSIALFYYYITSFLGRPVTNFVLVSIIVAFTYLNLTLSTQIRAYSLFLLISCTYFIVLHKLIDKPARAPWLLMHVLTGTLLVFTHNFGLFYLAASGAFFGLWWRWSRQPVYLRVLATHLLVALIWVTVWYPSFSIQAQAGKPHSWIDPPTFLSFFRTIGELAPTLSSRMEYIPTLSFLAILRVILVGGLFLYIAIPKLQDDYRRTATDKAFQFYLLSGFLYILVICLAFGVTVIHTSIFISRYLWPSHLLLIYQLVYAWYHFMEARRVPQLAYVLPVYVVLLGSFLFYQNRKVIIFPSGVIPYLEKLNPRYPVLVESAYYFLPIWFHKSVPSPRYLLDWESASVHGNVRSATVEYWILKSMREKYGIDAIISNSEFNKASMPHFYVIDEAAHYQIERFIDTKQIRVVRQLPIMIAGHRLLECVFR
ncbi:hypothetical protein [Spirosoma rigui]|uniref:hypothetical protein n=1 Tax=Spirosoma rigui TaxID=564064 RepID=UPI001FE8E7B2|nr:hypothetical protein [Spirosoma rigui]